MGYAYRGQCYETLALAQQAECQTSYPVQSADGGSLTVVSCTGVGSSGLTIEKTVDGAVSSTFSVAGSYADCSVEDVSLMVPSADNLAAGFSWGFCLVLGVYLIAWGAGRVLAFIKG